MARCFRDLCREELEDGGGLGLAALWAHTLPELLYSALKERSTMLARYVYRAAARVVLAAAFILMLPLLAMQVTDQVVWDLADFAVAGALLVSTGLIYELAARKAGNIAYRACSMSRTMRAEVVGARVWNFVSEILTNPSNLAQGLERMIENERAPFTAEDEALWLKRIAELDLKHERLLDLRLDGDIAP
jgi:hypothetical protein